MVFLLFQFLEQTPWSCFIRPAKSRSAKVAVYGAIHGLATRVPKSVQDREELTDSIARPSATNPTPLSRFEPSNPHRWNGRPERPIAGEE